MYHMTAKQEREIKKLVDKHVRGAINDYGVPPKCYGVTVDVDNDLIISTPTPDQVSHKTDDSFVRAVPTASGPIGASEVFADADPHDPDCVPWLKPSARIQYMRWLAQQMLEQGHDTMVRFVDIDYDRALKEPGYYHEGAAKCFTRGPLRYMIVRTSFALFIDALWSVPDKHVFTYLYITSRPKRLTHQKE